MWLPERWWVIRGWMRTDNAFVPTKQFFKPRLGDFNRFVSGPFCKGEAIIEADRLNRVALPIMEEMRTEP